VTLSASVWLADLRSKRKWSQHQLADKSGVARSVISSIELGTRAATMASIRGLAAAFGVSSANIVDMIEDENAHEPDNV